MSNIISMGIGIPFIIAIIALGLCFQGFRSLKKGKHDLALIYPILGVMFAMVGGLAIMQVDVSNRNIMYHKAQSQGITLNYETIPSCVFGCETIVQDVDGNNYLLTVGEQGANLTGN